MAQWLSLLFVIPLWGYRHLFFAISHIFSATFLLLIHPPHVPLSYSYFFFLLLTADLAYDNTYVLLLIWYAQLGNGTFFKIKHYPYHPRFPSYFAYWTGQGYLHLCDLNFSFSVLVILVCADFRLTPTTI